jgi:transposase
LLKGKAVKTARLFALDNREYLEQEKARLRLKKKQDENLLKLVTLRTFPEEYVQQRIGQIK